MAQDASGDVVTAITVCWNDADDALRCVASLQASDYQNLRLLIVDNGSRLDEAERLRAGLDDVPLIRLPENTGYTGGFNVGMRRAIADGASWIVLVNSDARVEPGAITALVEAAAAQPDAALVGAVIVTDGADDVLISAGATLDKRIELIHHGIGGPPPERGAPPYPAQIVSGCVLLVRAAAVAEVGLLDEDFFAYYEDVDWSLRARRAGYGVFVVPAARAYHPDTRRRDERSSAVTYYSARNRLLVARKHAPSRLPFVWARLARTGLSWTLRPRWRDRRSQRDALVLALADAARGYHGSWRDRHGRSEA